MRKLTASIATAALIATGMTAPAFAADSTPATTTTNQSISSKLGSSNASKDVKGISSKASSSKTSTEPSTSASESATPAPQVQNNYSSEFKENPKGLSSKLGEKKGLLAVVAVLGVLGFLGAVFTGAIKIPGFQVPAIPGLPVQK